MIEGRKKKRRLTPMIEGRTTKLSHEDFTRTKKNILFSFDQFLYKKMKSDYQRKKRRM